VSRVSPSSGKMRLLFRLEMHVHWLGRNDDGDDLGYAACSEHPGNGTSRYAYCAKCLMDEKTSVP
jgi:hypothetical protein